MIILTALILTVLLQVLWRLFRLITEANVARLVSFNHWAARFETHALALSSVEQTPEQILVVLAQLNSMIGGKRSSRALFKCLHAYNKRKFDENKPEIWNQIDEEAEKINRVLRENLDLRRPFREALKSGLLCMSFSDLFWGFRARALMAELEYGYDIGVGIISVTEFSSLDPDQDLESIAAMVVPTLKQISESIGEIKARKVNLGAASV